MIDEIKKRFFEYAKEQGTLYKEFPLTTDIEEFGAPYIEISKTGKLFIVGRDHGQETYRKEADSPEQLAKMVYHLFNK